MKKIEDGVRLILEALARTRIVPGFWKRRGGSRNVRQVCGGLFEDPVDELKVIT
jgi:hypothetical protein